MGTYICPMKNLLLVSLVFLTILPSCNRDVIEIKFKLNYSTNFTIESGGLLNFPLDFFTPDVTTNAESEFEANDTRKDKVKEVSLDELVLTITAPEGRSFDFLKDIYLFISAEGLEEQQYAFYEDVPDGLTRLELNATGIDLASYIKEEKFKLRSECVLDRTLTQNIDVQADMVFNVRANPLK